MAKNKCNIVQQCGSSNGEGSHLCNSVNWDFIASPSVFQIINNGNNITIVVVKR